MNKDSGFLNEKSMGINVEISPDQKKKIIQVYDEAVEATGVVAETFLTAAAMPLVAIGGLVYEAQKTVVGKVGLVATDIYLMLRLAGCVGGMPTPEKPSFDPQITPVTEVAPIPSDTAEAPVVVPTSTQVEVVGFGGVMTKAQKEFVEKSPVALDLQEGIENYVNKYWAVKAVGVFSPDAKISLKPLFNPNDPENVDNMAYVAEVTSTDSNYVGHSFTIPYAQYLKYLETGDAQALIPPEDTSHLSPGTDPFKVWNQIPEGQEVGGIPVGAVLGLNSKNEFVYYQKGADGSFVEVGHINEKAQYEKTSQISSDKQKAIEETAGIVLTEAMKSEVLSHLPAGFAVENNIVVDANKNYFGWRVDHALVEGQDVTIIRREAELNGEAFLDTFTPDEVQVMPDGRVRLPGYIYNPVTGETERQYLPGVDKNGNVVGQKEVISHTEWLELMRQRTEELRQELIASGQMKDGDPLPTEYTTMKGEIAQQWLRDNIQTDPTFGQFFETGDVKMGWDNDLYVWNSDTSQYDKLRVISTPMCFSSKANESIDGAQPVRYVVVISMGANGQMFTDVVDFRTTDEEANTVKESGAPVWLHGFMLVKYDEVSF